MNNNSRHTSMQMNVKHTSEVPVVDDNMDQISTSAITRKTSISEFSRNKRRSSIQYDQRLLK